MVMLFAADPALFLFKPIPPPSEMGAEVKAWPRPKSTAIEIPRTNQTEAILREGQANIMTKGVQVIEGLSVQMLLLHDRFVLCIHPRSTRLCATFTPSDVLIVSGCLSCENFHAVTFLSC